MNYRFVAHINENNIPIDLSAKDCRAIGNALEMASNCIAYVNSIQNGINFIEIIDNDSEKQIATLDTDGKLEFTISNADAEAVDNVIAGCLHNLAKQLHFLLEKAEGSEATFKAVEEFKNAEQQITAFKERIKDCIVSQKPKRKETEREL